MITTIVLGVIILVLAIVTFKQYAEKNYVSEKLSRVQAEYEMEHETVKQHESNSAKLYNERNEAINKAKGYEAVNEKLRTDIHILADAVKDVADELSEHSTLTDVDFANKLKGLVLPILKAKSDEHISD